MKRKLATMNYWKALLNSRFVATTIDEPDFRGTIALICVDHLTGPAYGLIADQQYLFSDTGYSLVQYLPDQQHHVITAYIDRHDQITHWYIDMINTAGFTDTGIPWYDDLYLDLVQQADGAQYLLDAEELDAALADQLITQAEWTLAWAEARRLQAALQQGPLPAMRRWQTDLQRLRALPMQTRIRPTYPANWLNPVNPEMITFRRLQTTDLPLLHRWLNTPHVKLWYGNSVQTFAAVQEKYLPRIAGSDPTTPYLLSYSGEPIGYIQTYRVVDDPEYAALVDDPGGAAAIDYLIGEERYTLRGVGTAGLRAFLRQIVFDAPTTTHCYIDPHPANFVAIHAYRRVGFQVVRRIEPPETAEPTLLLRISRAAI